jgi:hypothetical protein
MNTYTRQPSSGSCNQGQRGEQCTPEDPDPADQPKKPCTTECEKLPECQAPVVPEPEKCAPPPECVCPPQPSTTSNCLQELIDKAKKGVSEGDRAKQSQADLEALLAKAKIATADYTHDKYKKLIAEWERQDLLIADFIRKLVCAVPCWNCIIECFICPLIYDIRYRNQLLYGDGQRYTEAYSLLDLRYWHDRNRTEKKARLDRIKAVLSAWEKPGATIEKNLADDLNLLNTCSKGLDTGGKLVYDVFLRLVPMHLAIAPPASSGRVTHIAKQFTEFCECDVGVPDDCCGPDVGILSIRESLVGPQPYLIAPHEYYEIICCLTTKRYQPAKDAWSTAESGFEQVDALITRYTAEVLDKSKNLAQNARSALPVSCNDWNEKPPAAATISTAP